MNVFFCSNWTGQPALFTAIYSVTGSIGLLVLPRPVCSRVCWQPATRHVNHWHLISTSGEMGYSSDWRKYVSVHRKYTNFYVLLMSLSTLKLPRYKLAISKSVLVNSTGHMLESGEHPTKYVKEWFNCKTRMPGTVKCRPTVAYWVQIDGINIATELITRYCLNGTLIQCCFNARPTSATLAQHWTNIE